MPGFIEREVMMMRTDPTNQQRCKNNDRMNSMMHGFLLEETS
jgi:hypothetical protein